MLTPPLLFIASIFATWRLAHLVAYEDGPWGVMARLRRAVGNGEAGRVMDCSYCLTLWFAVPCAALLTLHGAHWVVTWLGIAGGASLLERLSDRRGGFTPPAALVETELSSREESDVLLWEPARRPAPRADRLRPDNRPLGAPREPSE